MAMQIKVPASSANLGPGFDSIGLAVDRYLKVTVLEPTETWVVDHDLPQVSHGATNMIVQAALQLTPALPPHHLLVQNEIPLSHGLGSSSAAIVAGIELANQLADLQLTPLAKVQHAARLEGHPDNVAPAILGGVVVGTSLAEKFVAVQAPVPPVALVAYIPKYNLATKAARAALPAHLAFGVATHASAIANTLVAALFAQRYDLVGPLMEADQFHEPARAALVPELAQLREIGHQVGTVATYLSGAGPTVMTLLKPTRVAAFQNHVRQAGLPGQVWQLQVDQTGVQVVN